MNELEELITAHLERTAARAEPRPDLDRVLDAARAPGAATLAPAPPSPAPSPRRSGWLRPMLAVAAAVIVVAAGVVSISLATRGGSDPDDPDDPVTRPPSTPTTQPAGPPSPLDGVRLQPQPQAPLGDGGFAIISGDRITLHDAEGTAVAEGTVPPGGAGNTASLDVHEENGELVLTGVASEYSLAGLPEGQDCAELYQGDEATIETCRVSPDEHFGQELVYVTADGDRRTLADPDDVGAQPGIGQWDSAVISPDGEWVAAQWIAECEVRIAFLISVVDGTIVGTDAAPLPDGLQEAETIVLGWHDDQALIAAPSSVGGCATAEDPGVYAVDPAAGTASVVTPLSENSVNESVLPWRRQS